VTIYTEKNAQFDFLNTYEYTKFSIISSSWIQVQFSKPDR